MNLLNAFSTSFHTAGSPVEPQIASTRIAFVTIFFFNLVFFTFYSASLTSFLAIHKPLMPFENLEDLVANSNYKLVTLTGTAYEDMLKNGKWFERQLITTGRFETVDSVQTGLYRASIDDVAFLWAAEATVLAMGQQCLHIKTQKPWRIGQVAMVQTKHGPYQGLIDF